MWAFLVFHPVFDAGGEELRGFALGVYRVPELVTAGIGAVDRSLGISITEQGQALDFHPPPAQTTRHASLSLPVFGRTWQVELAGQPEDPVRWVVERLLLLLGVLLVGLLAWSVRQHLRQTEAIRREVILRTAELEQTTRALQESKEAAEKANAAKSRFLAVMSHELRTPLNGMLGTTSLLLESGLSDEQAELARTGQSSGLHLLSLLNELLDLNRIEEGKLELERRAFSPAESCEAVLRLYQQTLQQRGVA